MNFTSETSSGGVRERAFDIVVNGNLVPAVVWAPEDARGPRPLLLMGHGGGLHKTAPRIVDGARRYVETFGYAVAAIDAPDHGARLPPEEPARLGEEMRRQIAESGGMHGAAARAAMRRAAQAQPEWRAVLDALQALDFVGRGQPVGYSGVSLGALLGIPFVAVEPRISAAVFGLAGLGEETDLLEQSARSITAPVLFVMQWDDNIVPRQTALALFDALGSTEKTLHANRGDHMEVPPFERAGWERFLVRNLGAAQP